jgi:hypothetical protein
MVDTTLAIVNAPAQAINVAQVLATPISVTVPMADNTTINVSQVITSVVAAIPAGIRGEGYDNILSDTSIAFSTGSKVISVNRIGAFLVGMRVRLASGLSWQEGIITALDYFNKTITVNVSLVNGTGTYTNWLVSVAGEKGEQGLQGLQGIKGDTGTSAGSVLTLTANADFGGNRAVMMTSNGLAYADNTVLTSNVLGFTARAAVTGDSMDIITINDLSGFSNLTVGGAVYLSTNGTITQTIPTAGLLQTLGTALSPTKINIKIQPPIEV